MGILHSKRKKELPPLQLGSPLLLSSFRNQNQLIGQTSICSAPNLLPNNSHEITDEFNSNSGDTASDSLVSKTKKSDELKGQRKHSKVKEVHEDADETIKAKELSDGDQIHAEILAIISEMEKKIEEFSTELEELNIMLNEILINLDIAQP